MVANAPNLSEQIDFQISTSGPMSVATYMGLCLTHPTKGYYRTDDPLGAAGDFVTAPEISQMFGEMVGFYVAQFFQQMSAPNPVTLLELGPGRGTLMADMLRVLSRLEGFRAALDLRLFETSPTLIAEQKTRLAEYNGTWITDFDQVGTGPLLVVANEFFDALPIRQFVKQADGWHERVIGLVDGQRCFGLNPSPIPEASIPETLRGAEINAVCEVALAGTQIMDRLARTVARNGGAILAIDYGYGRTQTGETLQGVRRHQYADVLDAPGETDLSAHVDFEALSSVAARAGLAVAPLATQGEFLTRLGIGERTQSLRKANPQAAADLEAARNRLVAPDQMGSLFKVFCAHSPGLQPPGFA